MHKPKWHKPSFKRLINEYESLRHINCSKIGSLKIDCRVPRNRCETPAKWAENLRLVVLAPIRKITLTINTLLTVLEREREERGHLCSTSNHQIIFNSIHRQAFKRLTLTAINPLIGRIFLCINSHLHEYKSILKAA